MRFGSMLEIPAPRDLSRRQRRCTVCGSGAFSWILTSDGRSICTACYQDVQPRVTVFESENGGDLPPPHPVPPGHPVGVGERDG
jgi:hypothetical protein